MLRSEECVSGIAPRSCVRGTDGQLDWRDEGLLISVRRHGEIATIIEAFTAGHDRHAGVVPGGAGRTLLDGEGLA